MNNSTKKFIVSNSFYAISEVLQKASETQENETMKNTLFGLAIAAKIGMNIFIIKGVFDKLNEANRTPVELQEIVVDNAPRNAPQNPQVINLNSLESARI